MDSPVLKLNFLSIILFFLTCHSLLSAANSDMISDVCKQTRDESRCLAILRSDPPASSAKNWFDLSKAILEISIRRGKETQSFLKRLYEKTRDPTIRRCATVSYGGVVGSFVSALEELKEDTLTANYDSKVAGDDAVDCEMVMKEDGVRSPEISSRMKSEISSRNKLIRLLSMMAFLATDMLPES